MQRPSRLLLALESRAMPEFGAFMGAIPAMRACLPRGEGQPVLVLPGFMASDISTAPMRSMLNKLGYPTYGWNIGRNVGPTDFVLDGLVDRIEELVNEHQQPLSVIGWSLGGIYAREMARLAPDHVRDIVTLGSPFQMEEPRNSNAAPLHDMVRGSYSDKIDLPRLPDYTREPLPVPSTAVFSRTDGIVLWDDCIDVPDSNHDNVEVYGSHCGLGHNVAAMVVIADRLAQPAGHWAPFVPPKLFAHLYPDTSRLQVPVAS